MRRAAAKFLIGDSAAEGEALVLTGPISFWGGVDPRTGKIIDVRHPQHDKCVAGKVLFIPTTIGSSTASTILLELVHGGKAPAAIVLHEPDAILLLGLIAARELEMEIPPALVLSRDQHGGFAGSHVTVGTDGTVSATF